MAQWHSEAVVLSCEDELVKSNTFARTLSFCAHVLYLQCHTTGLNATVSCVLHVTEFLIFKFDALFHHLADT